jgi:glutathione-regulated potassium-efflux system ancillary protein KefF
VILVLLAHPYPDRSRANRALTRAIEGLEGVTIRSLYDLHPDFVIDVAAEREALLAAQVVVWQHPIHWYSVPALLKLWFEKVLGAGWAFGPGGTALHGKQCLWVVTTGGDEASYAPGGMHRLPMSSYQPVVENTARFCGMDWLDPIVVHAAHRIEDEHLAELGERYRARLVALRHAHTRVDHG